MNFRDVVRVRGCVRGCVRACVRGYVLHGSSLVLCYTTLIAISIRASRGARVFEHNRPGGTLYNKWDLQGDV